MFHELIGNTRVMRLAHLRAAGCADLLLKIESTNLSGSLKIRAAHNMVATAQRTGKLTPGRPLVEPSSGNLGIALAAICARQRIPCHLVVDPRMTDYSRNVMRSYGAHIHQVDVPDERGSWQGSRLALAKQLAAELGGHMLIQYDNPANASAHESTTGPEILADLGGPPDVCVVGVSTGGTISGVGRSLKRTRDTRVVAVDVEGSSIFGGDYRAYRLRGLGLSWWPANLDRDAFDDVYRVGEDLAFSTAQLLAAKEGILSGGSAGAVVAVAVAQAMAMPRERTVLGIVAEKGDRYLQTIFNAGWRKQYSYSGVPSEEHWLGQVGALQPLNITE